MNEINNSENINKLAAKIREEIAIRSARHDTSENLSTDNAIHTDEPLPKCPSIKFPEFPPDSHLQENKQYSVDELLNFHDHEFITIAYQYILGRLPDPEGMHSFLTRLRQGKLSQIEILGRLRFSPEGRSKKAKVSGLLMPFAIQSSYKIPIAGHISRILIGLINLPKILKNIEKLNNTLFVHRNEMRQNSKEFYQQLVQLRNHVENLQQAVSLKLSTKASVNDLHEFSEKLNHSFSKINSHLNALEDQAAKTISRSAELEESINSVENRAKAGSKQIKDLNHKVFAIEEALAGNAEPDLDILYAKFEDQFRGTFKEIKERQRIYLPLIKEVAQQVEDGEVIDLGCGRGEWLELLKENGYLAKGVDINSEMVARCLNIGLDVIENDVDSYLRKLPPNSVLAITGFHIIEHLNLTTMISIFDECFRVLMPGGIIIFETPNPENLTVGAYSFHIDPTHNKPLVPNTMEFILTQRGFREIDILKLNKSSEFFEVSQINEFAERWFNSELDYAIKGSKI